MSVNLSARQFKDSALVESIAAALDEAGLAPESLILEVTESAAMEDLPLTTATFRELKDLGTRLALDDFGSGYSSLSYLKRFPVDMIKIDRSIVTGLDKEPSDRAIVAATITMAHALGLEATAEGVESAEEVAVLRELRCDLGQGNYWWTARPAETAATLLASHAV